MERRDAVSAKHMDSRLKINTFLASEAFKILSTFLRQETEVARNESLNFLQMQLLANTSSPQANAV